MDKKKDKGKKVISILIVVIVIAGLGIWIFLTSNNSEETSVSNQTAKENESIQDKYVGGAYVSRDLSKVALTPELKNQIQVWQDQGFIEEIKLTQHEVWINGDMWKTYSMEKKNKIADTLSEYMKAHDGTPQILIHDYGSDEMLAEILGNYRDFY